MNESKVVRYEPYCTEKFAFMERDEDGLYVPHADHLAELAKRDAAYKAIEEKYAALLKTEREGYTEYHRTREELASLKARVRELVEADKALDIAEAGYRDARREKGNWNVNPVAHNHPALLALRGAQERRRLALEALK